MKCDNCENLRNKLDNIYMVQANILAELSMWRGYAQRLEALIKRGVEPAKKKRGSDYMVQYPSAVTSNGENVFLARPAKKGKRTAKKEDSNA